MFLIQKYVSYPLKSFWEVVFSLAHINCVSYVSLAKVISSASTLPPRPWWGTTVCWSRPWLTLRPSLRSLPTSRFHKGALWPSLPTDAPSTWCSRWQTAPVFQHRIFLWFAGSKKSVTSFKWISKGWKTRAQQWQLCYSHYNWIIVTGSHWYWEGSRKAVGEKRGFGETGGEAEWEDVEEWLQGEGANEGARAGCWEGEERIFLFSSWGRLRGVESVVKTWHLFLLQLRQSQTELEKVKEAAENFRKMMWSSFNIM